MMLVIKIMAETNQEIVYLHCFVFLLSVTMSDLEHIINQIVLQ